jgi:hypothetical protein
MINLLTDMRDHMMSANKSDTDNSNNNGVDFRAEFDSFKNQVSDLFDSLKKQGAIAATKAVYKTGNEVGRIQEKTSNVMDNLTDNSSNSDNMNLAKINDQIRQSPVLSLALAFSAGYVISRMLGNGSGGSKD